MTFIYMVFEVVDYDHICLLKKLFTIHVMSIFYCLPFSFYSCIKFMRSLIEGLFCIEVIWEGVEVSTSCDHVWFHPMFKFYLNLNLCVCWMKTGKKHKVTINLNRLAIAWGFPPSDCYFRMFCSGSLSICIPLAYSNWPKNKK